MKPNVNFKGFSTFELLVVVGVIGIIAGITYPVITAIDKSSHKEKLLSDVSTLNRAVMAFNASGGDLGASADPKDILARLRSAALATEAHRLPGFSASLIDPRIAIAEQSEREAGRTTPRAYWDNDLKRFVIADSGKPGIKEFYLNPELAENEIEEIDRSVAMKYSAESNWVWDYQEIAPSAPRGPSQVTTTAVPNTGVPVTPVPSLPPFIPPVVANLIPPVFTIPGGSFDVTDFDLAVALINPNPAGSSNVFYSVDFGPWQPYAGPIVTGPGTTISAQAISTDLNRFRDSSRINQTYNTTSIPLLPPVIQPSHSGFGLFYSYDIDVTLVNPNDPTVSLMQYRIDNGPWLTYSGPFQLLKTTYPNGAIVEAKSISSGSPNYLPSTVTSTVLSIDALNINGSTTGSFYNPVGPSEMVTNLAGGNRDSYFEWGDVNGRGGGRSKSTMNYVGGSFSDLSSGSRFDAGTLTYYNGTINSGTGADTIDLDVSLSININGNIFNPFFGYTFDLINTLNDASDPWGSADIVRLDDAVASRTIVINDYEFEFRLEFGETTASGFSEFNEFHVLENESASVQLYGTLVGIGEVWKGLGGTEDATFEKVIVDATEPEPIAQKDGYVDAAEYLKDLVDFANTEKATAKDGYETAKNGADDALKGAEDTQKKIDEEKFNEAENLAIEAAAGLLLAEEGALAAEEAAAEAQNAVDVANSVLADDPENEDLIKITAEVLKKAGEAAVFAINARIFANNAATDAAIAATAWDSFLANGPVDDPLGFTEFLEDSSKLSRDTAKNGRDDAEDFSDDAVKGLEDAQGKVDDGKFDEAQQKADEGIAAAIASEQQAQIAEAAAVTANEKAAQAAAILAANPTSPDFDDIEKAANEAADLAAEAQQFANDARIAADIAADAEMQIAALILTFP